MKKAWVCVTILILLISPKTSLAQEDTWVRKADMPTARVAASSNVVDGKIYVIGGAAGDEYVSTVEVYDPVTDTWTQKADMPTPRWGLTTGVVNGKIYAIGGHVGLAIAVVEEYDPITDTWTRKTDMPTARVGCSASVIDGMIYVVGGGLGGVSPLATVEKYDPSTDIWTSRADMQSQREGLSTSVVNGKIYAIGGYYGSVTSLVEEYDPATDTWTWKANMPTVRMYFSASEVNGRIYAVGGNFMLGVMDVVEMYDPKTDTWSRKASMPTKRTELTTSAVNGYIYVIGGGAKLYNILPVVGLPALEVYDTGDGIRVVDISPHEGDVRGGEGIVILGRNFPPDAEVTIGGKPLMQSDVKGTFITGKTPPGEEGRHDVHITAPSIDFIVPAGDFIYNVISSVVVRGITPTDGKLAGGDVGRIVGSGFLPGATVAIGGVQGKDVEVTPTLIIFTIPPGTVGVKEVFVTNPNGERGVLRDGYTYNLSPVIEEIEPEHGGPLAGGTEMTITGDNFVEGIVVHIGDERIGQLEFFSSTELRLRTPEGKAGTAPVRVINPDGQEAIIEEGFRYNPAPLIYGIKPDAGALEGGTLITITGNRFIFPVDVLINGTEVDFPSGTNVSAEKITAKSPPSTAGVKDVTVINPDGQRDTLKDAFTYNPAPIITRVIPNNGRLAGGTSITVQGSGFLPGARVLFSINEQTYTAASSAEVVSSSIITALTPPGEPGAKRLMVSNPDKQYVTLQEGFTYNPLPAVISITPNYGSASGGAKVIIQGTGFLQGVRVMIGERSATAQWLDETAIEAVAPANPQGVWDVRVINPDTQEAIEREGFISVGELAYNYPNPFSASEGTTFRYVTDKPVESMMVRVFNMAGVPIDIVQQTGSNEVEWHNTEAHGGLYIYLIEVQLEDGSKKQFRNTMEVYE